MQRWRLLPSLTRPGVPWSKSPSFPARTITCSPSKTLNLRQSRLRYRPGPLHRPHSRLYSSQSHDLHISSPANRTDPSGWVGLLEDALPSQLQAPGDRPHQDLTPEQSIELIKAVVVQSRLRVNIDPLFHLGANQGRWDAFVWISCALIEDSRGRVKDSAKSSIQWCQDWAIKGGLGVTTKRPVTFHGIEQYSSLDEQTLADPPNGSLLAGEAHTILGHLWRTLGSLILEGSNPDKHGANLLIIGAQRVIAQLHRSELIPWSVYQGHAPNAATVLTQPVLPHGLFQMMMTSMYEAEVYPYPDEDEEPTSQFIARMHELGPGIWMEFILSCCVRGQWVFEGSHILADMRRCKYPYKWNTLPWIELKSSLAEKLDTMKYRPVRRSHLPPKELVEESSIERTVSTEAVTATIDGLVDILFRPFSELRHSHSAGAILDLISSLKSLLNQNSMSLGLSTWDALIGRLAETPAVHVEDNPNIMEAVLEKLSETYGVEMSAMNAPGAFDERDSSPSYILQGSVIIISLYHEVLSAFITLRDVNGATRILKKLQSLTDSNKRKSIADFFERLKRQPLPATSAVSDQFSFTSKFPGITFPSFAMQVPTPTLGRFLDLCTYSRQFEVGRWLLRDDWAEEAIIPTRLYPDEKVSPAIIRFAAATGDLGLLSQMTQATSERFRASTLAALCETQLRRADWEGALRALYMLKDESAHVRTIDEFARFISAIMMHFSEEMDGRAAHVHSQAMDVLSEMLNGRFGNLWGQKQSHLDSVIGFLASINKPLGLELSKRLENSRTFSIDLPVTAFDALLAGVAQRYGSSAAQKLFDVWCNENLEHRSLALPQLIVRSVRWESFQRPFPFRALNGVIEPNISTLRVIAHQALDEFAKAQTEDTELTLEQSGRSELLDWLTRVMRVELGMSDEAIDYELEGYLSTTENPAAAEKPPYYSEATLKVWRAIATSRKQWVERTEDSMRELATSQIKKFVVTEPGPPAERYFVNSLAQDLKLNTTPVGEEPDVAYRVTKRSKSWVSWVPVLKVADVAGRYFRDSWRRKFPMSTRSY